jgi:hypothetical protein
MITYTHLHPTGYGLLVLPVLPNASFCGNHSRYVHQYKFLINGAVICDSSQCNVPAILIWDAYTKRVALKDAF